MPTENVMANREERVGSQPSSHAEEAGEVATNGTRPATKRTSASSTTSASSVSIVKDALKPNMSAVEATSQLKVLCRKFAALTEKVKEETRTREEAEKEVRRLRAIVDGNDAPVVSSCRVETQVYIRELKEANETLKKDLREEQAKNAKLVSKALELEKEKSELLVAVGSCSQVKVQEAKSAHSDPMASQLSRRTSGWDREQSAKIQETLRTTIDDLQDELTRKEEELNSYRDRLQRERTRVKTLEVELQEREEASREEHCVLKELESSIQEQRDQFEAIEKEMQATEQRLEEEATIRSTLEQQIETLNDVNAALEQRAKALVRRIELNQSMADEMEELKHQVRDVEVDKETLVRSIKEVKDQHFVKETQWKAQLEQLRSEKLVLSAQISDLQNEISSLRNQNSLLSEWMLVRSENVAAAKQQQNTQNQKHDDSDVAVNDSSQQRGVSHQPHRPHDGSDSYSNWSRTRVRPLVPSDLDVSFYTHSSTRCPLSPSKTRSMTTASPIKQKSLWLDTSRRTSMSSSASSSEGSEKSGQNEEDPSDYRGKHRRSAKPKIALPTRGGSSGTRITSKLSDHERLRELMSRNRELQSRLQQETLATRNLEQEITHITSQRGHGMSVASRTQPA